MNAVAMMLLLLVAVCLPACVELPGPPFELELPADATAEQVEMVAAAAAHWNARLGHETFRMGDCSECSLISVHFYARGTGKAGGVRSHKRDDLWTMGLAWPAYQHTVEHELGHTLQLVDVDDPTSVMHRQEVHAHEGVEILDADVQWVLSRWY